MTNSDSSKTKIRDTIDLRKHKSNLLEDEYRSRIDSKKWLDYTFADNKLENHFKKHSKVLGITSIEEVLNASRKLLSKLLSDDVKGFVYHKGAVFKISLSVNEFTCGSENWNVMTYYKHKKDIFRYL